MTPAWLTPLASASDLPQLSSALTLPGRVDLAGLAGVARALLPLLLTDMRLLVVTPHEHDIETLTADLTTLARELEQDGPVLSLPSPGPPPYHDLPRHPEASLRRAVALRQAARCRAIVTSPAALLRPVIAPHLFATRVLTLKQGEDMLLELLLEALAEGGYRHEDPVTTTGQMARRGGIVDVFTPDAEHPVRIEFNGDTIESLRPFDIETQRSLGTLAGIEIAPLSDVFLPRSAVAHLQAVLPERCAHAPEAQWLLKDLARGVITDTAQELLVWVPEATVPAWAYFKDACLVAIEPDVIRHEAVTFWDRALRDFEHAPEVLAPRPTESLVSLTALDQLLDAAPQLRITDIADSRSGAGELAARPTRPYMGDLRALLKDLHAFAGHTTMFLSSAGKAERMAEILRDDGLAHLIGSRIVIRTGALSRGVEWPRLGYQILTDGDIFPEEVRLHPRRSAHTPRGFLTDFRDLKNGDLVVHQDHGIGRYEGLQTIEVAGVPTEFLVLSYQGGDKLKVPLDALDRIQKYASAEGARPAIERLGSGRWQTVKRKVKKAMRDMAEELLKLYAERKARPGRAFAAISPWMSEFEAAFPFDETPDQHTAIADVAEDMASRTPMDRLICGDVGYGKTEVAMRASMRAVLEGTQVAVLAPTTVLAFQHQQTFRRRFAPFPVRIEMVSRLRRPGENKAVLEQLKAGQIDILIGTHRLLSKDVEFRELGLIIIDEEQRFGVAAKERLKHMRTTVDCLTLSATPIPRTLQMGMTAIRDMSIIETPPKDRLAIHTSIVKFSTETIAAAIRQELARDGQVYFVHNRIESIFSMGHLIEKLCPEARVAVAHGQMPEAVLEQAMLAFVEGRVNVLVSTTIIENGLDIPRANTIVINRADRLGLAQLYQLRGRVGRADLQAQALLLVPPDTILSEVARKRLAAIREFSDLGAGFRIAALDLELRGAGDLLGGRQSGHIEAVGFDLYMKLLDQTVRELKGEAQPETPRALLNLGLDIRIPEDYVPQSDQRISLYKRVSQVRDLSEIDRLRGEWRDRFGPLPPATESLLRLAELRLRAEALGVTQIDKTQDALVIRMAAEPPPRAPGLMAYVTSARDVTLSPAGYLRVRRDAGRPALDELDHVLAQLAREPKRPLAL